MHWRESLRTELPFFSFSPLHFLPLTHPQESGKVQGTESERESGEDEGRQCGNGIIQHFFVKDSADVETEKTGSSNNQMIAEVELPANSVNQDRIANGESATRSPGSRRTGDEDEPLSKKARVENGSINEEASSGKKVGGNFWMMKKEEFFRMMIISTGMVSIWEGK